MAKDRRSEAIWVEARERWQINVQRDGKRRTFTSSTPGRRGKHEAEERPTNGSTLDSRRTCGSMRRGRFIWTT